MFAKRLREAGTKVLNFVTGTEEEPVTDEATEAEGVEVAETEASDDEELSQRERVERAIIALGEGTHTTETIAEEAGLERDQASRRIYTLRQSGFPLEDAGRGEWTYVDGETAKEQATEQETELEGETEEEEMDPRTAGNKLDEPWVCPICAPEEHWDTEFKNGRGTHLSRTHGVEDTEQWLAVHEGEGTIELPPRQEDDKRRLVEEWECPFCDEHEPSDYVPGISRHLGAKHDKTVLEGRIVPA